MYSLLLAIIYLSFICLGLPDSLLGSAWPSMYPEFKVPVSYAGMISMIIAVGTVVSSLMSNRLSKRFGPGVITAASVGLTAFAVLGFSFAKSFPVLCALAVPYGLGAGSVDSSLNNYVALNYKSRHMSWLHCMWGVGTIAGPYAIGYSLSIGKGWSGGYRAVGILLCAFTLVLMLSIPLWKKNAAETEEIKDGETEEITSFSALKIKGVKEALLSFFCYCALEQTAMLWASSYMVLHNGISQNRAAGYASMFFIGITAGRAINGFLTFKFSDVTMIRAGQVIIAVGIVLMFIPSGVYTALAGLIIIGLGCAPIYPCVIHSTPQKFGKEHSQALIGIQMASAYVGICIMPPLFGIIAQHINVNLLPVYLLVLLVIMALTHESVVRKTVKQP